MIRLFDTIQVFGPKKNKFDLSHEKKLSFNMGDLVPVFFHECVPGDNYRVGTEVMARLAPLLAPVMHRVNVKVEYFKIPKRLIWDEFESYITGGKDGTDAPVMPFVYSDLMAGSGSPSPARPNYAASRTLADYLGLCEIQQIPSGGSGGLLPTGVPINVLPFRAYQLVYNEYYRDPNLSDPIAFSKGSGDIDAPVAFAEYEKLFVMRKRAWEKDYFTSALPFAQRGEQVSIPITGPAEITYLDQSLVKKSSDGTPVAAASYLGVGDGDGTLISQAGAVGPPPIAGQPGARVENIDSIDFPDGAVTVEELRRTTKLQQWLEIMARVGSRYVEVLRGVFNVKPSDARFQRPEMLGGGVAPMVISEVLQTVTTDTDPLGEMGGHGVSASRIAGFKTYCEEHCYILGILSVLPRTNYWMGLDKVWDVRSREEEYWPQFAQLGEQIVKNREVFFMGGLDPATPAQGLPNATFGYQSRYVEYKQKMSTTHGDFRGPLSYWTWAREFGWDADNLPPMLNEEFVTADVTTRPFAVDDGGATDHIWCQVYHKCDALRPMPYFNVPSL